jgi:hypothetical protein
MMPATMSYAAAGVLLLVALVLPKSRKPSAQKPTPATTSNQPAVPVRVAPLTIRLHPNLQAQRVDAVEEATARADADDADAAAQAIAKDAVEPALLHPDRRRKRKSWMPSLFRRRQTDEPLLESPIEACDVPTHDEPVNEEVQAQAGAFAMKPESQNDDVVAVPQPATDSALAPADAHDSKSPVSLSSDEPWSSPVPMPAPVAAPSRSDDDDEGYVSFGGLPPLTEQERAQARAIAEAMPKPTPHAAVITWPEVYVGDEGRDLPEGERAALLDLIAGMRPRDARAALDVALREEGVLLPKVVTTLLTLGIIDDDERAVIVERGDAEALRILEGSV